MEELTIILQDLNQGKINVDEAEQQILDLFDVSSSLFTTIECNCCYMTMCEHSTTCPQYTKNNDH
jgi:hypothetical protein